MLYVHAFDISWTFQFVVNSLKSNMLVETSVMDIGQWWMDSYSKEGADQVPTHPMWPIWATV